MNSTAHSEQKSVNFEGAEIAIFNDTERAFGFVEKLLNPTEGLSVCCRTRAVTMSLTRKEEVVRVALTRSRCAVRQSSSKKERTEVAMERVD